MPCPAMKSLHHYFSLFKPLRDGTHSNCEPQKKKSDKEYIWLIE